MAASARAKQSKLCRRTYFLQSGSAPTLSEMRTELGSELADIIIGTLEPSQRTAVQPDRLEVFDGSRDCATVGGHDSELVRGQIHEHIIRLGGKISPRVDGYWRERLQAAVAVGVSADEVDFLRFECRQKINIAREEERHRYDAMLQHVEETLRQQYREERGDLHRSYGEARALWGEFVCRKVRQQAKNMLCKIATHYRYQLEREVTRRLQDEKSQIVKQMEHIVNTAVEQQKQMDQCVINRLVYQYEELLRFAKENNGCLQAVEITREVCKQHATMKDCRSTQVSIDPSSLDDDVGDVEDACSNHLSPERVGNFRTAALSKYNVFVVSQCLPESEQVISNEETVKAGSMAQSLEGSVETSANESQETTPVNNRVKHSFFDKLMNESHQAKHCNNIYEKLFEDVTLCWEKMDPAVRENVTGSTEAARIDSAVGNVPTESKYSASSIPTEPCFVESNDHMAYLRTNLLPSTENDPVGEVMEEEQFAELFDLSKAENEIAIAADGFVVQYIRATSEDFASMFPKDQCF